MKHWDVDEGVTRLMRSRGPIDDCGLTSNLFMVKFLLSHPRRFAWSLHTALATLSWVSRHAPGMDG